METFMMNSEHNVNCRYIIIAATLLFVSGCATAPDIMVNQDPAANFGDYNTYGFPAELPTDKAGYGSLLSQYLKTAVSREMDARGYKHADNPDLLVNFYVHTQEKIKTSQTPASSTYYGYRGSRYGAWGGGYGTWGGYGGSGYETRVTQYTEGTLNVDVIDNQRGQLVWEATMVGKVSKDLRENLEPKVDEAISELFQSYWYVAGSSAMVEPK
jgi:hypothetical protein